MLQDTKKFLLEQIKLAQIIQIDAGMITQQGHIVPYIYRWLYKNIPNYLSFQMHTDEITFKVLSA